MSSITPSSGWHKPEAATLSSTLNWREYWRIESERVGTDWPTLLARAAGIVGGLYAVHVSRVSS